MMLSPNRLGGICRTSPDAGTNELALRYETAVDKYEYEAYLLEPDDWRADIFNYLKESARGATRKRQYMLEVANFRLPIKKKKNKI
jgi:hypothetical protein